MLCEVYNIIISSFLCKRISSIKIYIQHDVRETMLLPLHCRNDKRRLLLNYFQYKILNKI